MPRHPRTALTTVSVGGGRNGPTGGAGWETSPWDMGQPAPCREAPVRPLTGHPDTAGILDAAAGTFF